MDFILPRFLGIVQAVLIAFSMVGYSKSLYMHNVDNYGEDFSDGHTQARHSNGEGTTLDIQQIVIGRCWAYQRSVIGYTGAQPARYTHNGRSFM